MQEIDNIQKALDDFHSYESNLKPLYMLIKVDVDAGIVYDDLEADKYATNHCNNMEYELVDYYYPDSPQYPYIAK